VNALDWYVAAVMACPVAITVVVVCLVVHGAKTHAEIERLLNELAALRDRQTRHGGDIRAVDMGMHALSRNHNNLAASHGTLLRIVDNHIASHVESFAPSDN
jgi:hypothetical protein